MSGWKSHLGVTVVFLALCALVDATSASQSHGKLPGDVGCMHGWEQQEGLLDENDEVSLLQLTRVGGLARNAVQAQGGHQQKAETGMRFNGEAQQPRSATAAAPVALATTDAAVAHATPVAAAAGAPEAFYSMHMGYIPAGGSILVEVMTVERAKQTCASIPSCKGFSYEGGSAGHSTTDLPVRVYFKNKWGNVAGTGWTSYHRYETPDLSLAAQTSSNAVSKAPVAETNASTADMWAAEADKLIDRVSNGIDRTRAALLVTYQAVGNMVQRATSWRHSSNSTSSERRASNDVVLDGSHIEYMLLIVLCVPLLAGLAAVIAITVAGWTRSPGVPPPKSSALFTDSTTSGPVSEGPQSST
eukprot:gnl/TRDRNA2_/TRDRNA2_184253_c0_seq1.p1 gnl/TRDRNA2_/TRDRNA2_184253_c0~~gnl/TRDRNA2_/TRDRNA2_184253_c0_seq1.p1  ORF type:complete len:359 (+),score=56.67 gnl/TRDRNA2_/TRDRNA2_184253_c0_seq1:195-1271(+)